MAIQLSVTKKKE